MRVDPAEYVTGVIGKEVEDKFMDGTNTLVELIVTELKLVVDEPADPIFVEGIH